MAKMLSSSLRVQRSNMAFSAVTLPRASFSSKNLQYTNDMVVLNGFHNGAAANSDGAISLNNANDMLAKIRAMATPEDPFPAGRKFILAYVRAQYTWTPEADASFRKGIIDWSTERRLQKKLIKDGEKGGEKKAPKVK